MSHKIKIYIISMGLILFGAIQLSIPSYPALASQACNPAVDPGCPGVPAPTTGGNGTNVQNVDCPSGQANTDNTGCVALGNGCAKSASGSACLAQNPIIKYINDAITFFSGLIGVIVVGVIIVGGIQYSMAGDNASATQAARQRITNGLIALVAFLFVSAFLQWIVPGGL